MAGSSTRRSQPDIRLATNILEVFKILKETLPDETTETLTSLAKGQLEMNLKMAQGPDQQAAGAVKTIDIPRDVIKAIETMPKLKVDNWHAWNIDFEAALCAVPLARRIVFEDVDPDHESYDEVLDSRLVNIIRSSAERESSKNVRHIIDVRKWSGGRELYAHIKHELTKKDKLMASQIHMELTRVRLVSNDIEKAIYNINDIASRGIQVGVTVVDGQKISALATCSAYSQSYKGVWETLESTGRANDWDEVVTALLTRQDRLQHEPHSREPRQAALSTTSTNIVEGNQGKSAYRIGKRDPRNPGEPPKCFNCKQPYHISADCPFPKRHRPGNGDANRENVPPSNNNTTNNASNNNNNNNNNNGSTNRTEAAALAEEVLPATAIKGEKSNEPTKIPWILDSGATSHMTNDLTILSDIKPATGKIGTAGPMDLDCTAIGSTVVKTSHGNMKLLRVLFVPELKENLISLLTLIRSGVSIEWSKDKLTFKLKDGTPVEVPVFCSDTRPQILSTHHTAGTATSAAVDHLLLHETLGHPGPKHETRMIELPTPHADGTKHIIPQCPPCDMAKSTKARLPRYSSAAKSNVTAERLHIDILSQFAGHSSYRFALVVVDDYSSFVFVTPLINKGQAIGALIDIVARIERQTGTVVKRIRSDNDSVFLSNVAVDWKAGLGIEWEFATPYDSRGNGKVERMNRTLRERMQAALLARNVPYSLWPEAIEYAAVTINLAPSEDNKSPYELMWRKNPSEVSRFLQPFGCLAWVFVPERKRAGGKMC
ncbi:unnamed protein product [Jaminaea pallidilutea]